jgi:hypothetical protein
MKHLLAGLLLVLPLAGQNTEHSGEVRWLVFVRSNFA